VSIGRTIAVILHDPIFVASQHFSFPDFVISPELFPAGGAPQHKHIKTLPLYSSDIFEYINHHCSRFKYYQGPTRKGWGSKRKGGRLYIMIWTISPGHGTIRSIKSF
jgi:hypothetical protein